MPRYGTLNSDYIATGTTHDPPNYVVICNPAADDLARSLTDTSHVLF